MSEASRSRACGRAEQDIPARGSLASRLDLAPAWSRRFYVHEIWSCGISRSSRLVVPDHGPLIQVRAKVQIRNIEGAYSSISATTVSSHTTR